MNQPVAPLPEPERPELPECLRDATVYLRKGNGLSTGTVDLVRQDDPEQAYRIDDTRPEINLDDHHAPGWGRIKFAVRLPRLRVQNRIMFRLPLDDEIPERVAIKCLNIDAVDEALRRGTFEDPYRGINRMLASGDNIHVLGCIEALRDENTLYIVMPYCENGSLHDLPDTIMSEEEALSKFSQILDCLLYL